MIFHASCIGDLCACPIYLIGLPQQVTVVFAGATLSDSPIDLYGGDQISEST